MELNLLTNQHFSKLRVRIITDAPRNVDVRFVDGVFLIQCLVNLPSSFGYVANVILSHLASPDNRVDFA